MEVRRYTVYEYWDETEPPWDWGNVPWIVRVGVRWIMVILGFLAAEWSVNLLWDGSPFQIDGLGALLASTAIFLVVRLFLRPILFLFSLPCLLLTLGLFIFVINALILLFAEWVCDIFDINFAIDGFWPAFFGALVISLVGFLLSRLLRRNPMRPVRM
jgi:putative membrane protein